MPEVVLDGDEIVDAGVEEKNRPTPPPADPDVAPKGWRFDRETKRWVPRKRASKVADDTEEGPGAESGERPERPDSAWASPDHEGDRDKPTFVELTSEQQTEIEGMLELLVLPLLLSAENKDPICGAAFVQNWDLIRTRSLPLIARSPALVEWLTKAGGLRDWLAFGAAVAPVAKAVVQHHITKTIVLEEGQAEMEDLSQYGA